MQPGTGHKPLYSHLYFQVLVAIAIGIMLGIFWPSLGAQMKPLGDAFGDDDGGQVGVGGGDGWHYRCVGHPQPVNPVDCAVGVDDVAVVGVGSHCAGSHWVVVGAGAFLDRAGQSSGVVIADGGAGSKLSASDEPGERRDSAEQACVPGRLDHPCHIFGMAQVSDVDARWVGRVSRAEPHPSA